jgi:predicted nucleic acid-binding protein
VKYLLDTPLLAELLRSRSDEWVSRWVDAFNEDELCLSALTIGEITKSIESEPDATRKSRLYTWLNDELLVRFHGRVIPLDLEVIKEWGRVTAETETADKPLSAMDGLVAATVRARGLVLITYNREIFAGAGIEVSDPWQG